MTRTALTAGVCAALIVSLAGSSSADGRFEVYDIRVLDNITDILAADLNGDGLKDIIVIHTKGYPPRTQRWLSFFWQQPGGGFSTAADMAWRLPDAVAALDVGDMDVAPGEDLFALTPSGVYRMELPGDEGSPRLERVVVGVIGAVLPSMDFVPSLNFVQDWNGDGRDDVGIVSMGELFIFESSEADSLPDPQVLDMESRVGLRVHESGNGESYDEVSVTRHIPSFAPVDLEGDGDSDLVIHWSDQARFFLRRDGTLPSRPDSSLWLRLLDDNEATNRDIELSISVVDVDGDGIADLFGGKSIRQGVGDFSSYVELYFGDGTLDFRRAPDWSTTVQGMSSGHWLDIDGDGRKEFMLPVVSLGITDLVRILLTKKVKVEFYFYVVRENRAISQEADFVKEVTLEVGLDEGGDAQIINFEGDYDGDGRRDMVAATGENELSVYLGKKPSKGELFERKQEEKIQVYTFGEFRPLDLNGDRKDDMILFYKDNPDMRSRASIVVNRGTW